MNIIKVNEEKHFHGAKDVRKKVFVDEMQIDHSDEFDDYDDESHHFIAQNDEGETVGAARWRRTAQGIKLERFAVVREHRNLGIASQLLSAILDDIGSKPENASKRIYLHAHKEITGLYKKFGFREVGAPFQEAGVWVQEMER
ncbi:MAG: GNAT family N-acetyltransferase [Bacteroidota bacterium]